MFNVANSYSTNYDKFWLKIDIETFRGSTRIGNLRGVSSMEIDGDLYIQMYYDFSLIGIKKKDILMQIPAYIILFYDRYP